MPLPQRILIKREADPDEILVRVIHRVAERAESSAEFDDSMAILDLCRTMAHYIFQKRLIRCFRTKGERQHAEQRLMGHLTVWRSHTWSD